MQLDGIDHIAVAVSDVERSVQWYVDILGLERQHEGMWNGIPVFVGKGNTGIAFFSARGADSKSAPHNKIRMLHLAFRASRKNFLEAQQELKTRGTKFEFQDHEISHSIYFHDPDGHQLEITTYDVE